MKLYCGNPICDFDFEDNPTTAKPTSCPKCGGTWFQTPKFGVPIDGFGYASAGSVYVNTDQAVALIHPFTARRYRDGEPCNHPGCLRHVSHPCEGCGRIAGRYPSVISA